MVVRSLFAASRDRKDGVVPDSNTRAQNALHKIVDLRLDLLPLLGPASVTWTCFRCLDELLVRVQANDVLLDPR